MVLSQCQGQMSPWVAGEIGSVDPLLHLSTYGVWDEQTVRGPSPGPVLGSWEDVFSDLGGALSTELVGQQIWEHVM